MPKLSIFRSHHVARAFRNRLLGTEPEIAAQLHDLARLLVPPIEDSHSILTGLLLARIASLLACHRGIGPNDITTLRALERAHGALPLHFSEAKESTTLYMYA